MKNELKISMIFLIVGITGCLPLIEKWDDKITIARYDRASKAYYDKETPEQKELRKKNGLIYRKLAELPENRAKGGLKMDMILRDCMKERGSPLF